MKKSQILLPLTFLLSMSFLVGCQNKDNIPSYKEDSVQFHYYRKDGKYKDWDMWIWNRTLNNGSAYTFNGTDSFGGVASYALTTFGNDTVSSGLGFIVRTAGSWTKKDIEADRFVDFSKLSKDKKGVYHVYLKSGDKNVYTTPDGKISPEILSASFSNSSQIIVETNVEFKKAVFFKDNEVIGEQNLTNPVLGTRFTLPSSSKADFNSSYKVEITFKDDTKLSSNISIRTLFSTDDFSSTYTYNGNDLGVTYSSTSSLFKVWSPISTSIKLRIYNSGTPKSVSSNSGDDTYIEYDMNKEDKGVFSKAVTGDLAGKYYTYVVTNSTYQNKEIVDPYAKSAGVNGLRGMIVDFSKTNPDGWDKVTPLQIDRKALTVYETHVADITSSSTWNGNRNNRLLFTGAYEENTTYTSNGITVKTGFDHIKELGVNAVQLLPIFDSSNNEVNKSFNWGYNPLNYNCLDGGFSSNPYDGYIRIKEFKTLVQKYNEAGINIIMDVVYNHVSSALGSNFDVLMPGYYYRYDSKGALSNGSGCGNETASELPMMRKFMIDSTEFWAKEYKLGGFRFDLMGLHDYQTMNLLVENLKKVNKGIVVYGEPWTGGTSPLSDSLKANQANGNKFVGYGQFNDQFRDALIKGGLNGASAKGWISETSKVSLTDFGNVQTGLQGRTTSSSVSIDDPDKTINYVTCHDNYTLYDRFKAAGISDEDLIKKMAMLSNSMVFTSQGTTFMLAGEEFLRTKRGNSNSYDATYQVNELDYSLKIKNIDMFKNYQKLIKLKQNVDGLHLNYNDNLKLDYEVNFDGNQVILNINDSINNRTYKIVHMNGYQSSEKLTIDFSGYTLYLDTLDENKALTSSTEIEAFETLIAYK